MARELTPRLTVRMTDWLTWLCDYLIVWLTRWMKKTTIRCLSSSKIIKHQRPVDWLTDWLSDEETNSQNHWPITKSNTHGTMDRLSHWLAGWLTETKEETTTIKSIEAILRQQGCEVNKPHGLPVLVKGLSRLCKHVKVLVSCRSSRWCWATGGGFCVARQVWNKRSLHFNQLKGWEICSCLCSLSWHQILSTAFQWGRQEEKRASFDVFNIDASDKALKLKITINCSYVSPLHF